MNLPLLSVPFNSLFIHTSWSKCSIFHCVLRALHQIAFLSAKPARAWRSCVRESMMQLTHFVNNAQINEHLLCLHCIRDCLCNCAGHAFLHVVLMVPPVVQTRQNWNSASSRLELLFSKCTTKSKPPELERARVCFSFYPPDTLGWRDRPEPARGIRHPTAYGWANKFCLHCWIYFNHVFDSHVARCGDAVSNRSVYGDENCILYVRGSVKSMVAECYARIRAS